MSALGNCIMTSSALIYHTQQIYDVGFIPEIIMDDMVETNAMQAFQFPFHVNFFFILIIFLIIDLIL